MYYILNTPWKHFRPFRGYLIAIVSFKSDRVDLEVGLIAISGYIVMGPSVLLVESREDETAHSPKLVVTWPNLNEVYFLLVHLFPLACCLDNTVSGDLPQ